MASLNTQLGYKTTRPTGPAKKTTPTGMSSGVTRALAGVKAVPSAPSYSSPYADPTQTLFPQPAQQQVASTAPAGTPTSYAPQRPVAPQAPAGFSFDLETDPILQQMHAMAAKQRSEAEAGALAQRKSLAIQYGHQPGVEVDPALYPDQATAAAAEGNPFSVTANLAHEYQTGTQNLETQLNQHNLFYSGARINDLANALRDYQQQQAGAAGAFQSNLGNIDQNRIAALMGADQSEQGAYNDAYSRALAFALANQTVPAVPGPDPGGGGGGGGGVPGSSIANADRTAPGAAAYNGYDAPLGGSAGIDPGFNITQGPLRPATPSLADPSQPATDYATGQGLTGAGAVAQYGVLPPVGGQRQLASAQPTNQINLLRRMLMV